MSFVLRTDKSIAYFDQRVERVFKTDEHTARNCWKSSIKVDKAATAVFLRWRRVPKAGRTDFKIQEMEVVFLSLETKKDSWDWYARCLKYRNHIGDEIPKPKGKVCEVFQERKLRFTHDLYEPD